MTGNLSTTESTTATTTASASASATCDAADAKLQRRFDQINAQLRNRGGTDGSNALDDMALTNSSDDYGFLVGEEVDVEEFVPVAVSSMGGISSSVDMDGRDGNTISPSGSESSSRERDDPWQSLRKATEDARNNDEDSSNN